MHGEAQKENRISRDGSGNGPYNVRIGSGGLWRTVKSEEVYLRDDQSVRDARQGLTGYWAFYHHERLHQALGYRTPAAVYHGEDSGLERAGWKNVQLRPLKLTQCA